MMTSPDCQRLCRLGQSGGQGGVGMQGAVYGGGLCQRITNGGKVTRAATL
jgi:hypothetical protein